MAELFDSYLEHAIGGTPLVPLKNISSPSSGQVWVKLESGNPTGSYKDRMAYAVFKNALARGRYNNWQPFSRIHRRKHWDVFSSHCIQNRHTIHRRFFRCFCTIENRFDAGVRSRGDHYSK